jgi:hypothetical protein
MTIRSTFRKSGVKPEAPKKQAPNRFPIGRLFVFVLLVFGLYVGVGYLLTIPAFTVKTITLSENNVLVPSDIVPIVKEELSAKSLWPYKKDSIFLVPKRKIKERLFTEFGRLSDIVIKKEGLKEIVVRVKEKEGEYMWCGAVDEVLTHSDCFMVDAKGALFDVAPEVSGDAYFKIFGGSTPEGGKIGHEVLSLSDFNTIVHIKDGLEKYGIKPVAVLVYEDGLIEFLKKTEGRNLYDGARIKFTFLADHFTSLNNLFSAFESEPFKTEFAEKEKFLQYVDVRFDNRVYYKFN